MTIFGTCKFLTCKVNLALFFCSLQMFSKIDKMTRVWLASAILLCFAVTLLKSEKLNNRESGT